MKETERISHEIEATKLRISSKADALKGHLSTDAIPPLAHVKATLLGGGSKILDSFRENPFPMALMGLGFGWLMLRDARAASRSAPEMEGPETGASIKEAVHGATEKVKEAAGSVTGKTKEAVRTVGDKIAKAKGAAADSAKKASDWFSTSLEDKPLILALATLVVGIVAGLSLPISRKEAETVGELGEKVAGAVLEKSSEALEQAEVKTGETGSPAEKEPGMNPE